MSSSEGERILILGAGFGGLATANLLQKNLSLSSVRHQISIVDSKDYFIMGLVNLWILSGIRTLEDSKIALNRLENKGISYLNGEVASIDPCIKDCHNQSKFDSQIRIRLFGNSIRIRICT